MRTEIVEFRFPDGDFELDSTEQLPNVGSVVTKNGRVWKVDAVKSGTPTVVILQLCPREKHTV
jgi:hypothetical protein